MLKKQITLTLFFLFGTMLGISAQENKLVVLSLKNGYSVKGEIIEQTAQSVKIKALNGEIYEYKTDEISSTVNEKISSPPKLVHQTIAKGEKMINIGLGLISFSSIGYAGNERLTMPPIPVSFEYVVKDDLFNGKGSLGIGGFLGFKAALSDGNYYNTYNYRSSRLIIGVRGYAHYALREKMDTYAGVLLGYKSDVIKYDSGEKMKDGTPTLNVFVGCRYFLTDKIAGMAELGWGTSILTIGVAVKL